MEVPSQLIFFLSLVHTTVAFRVGSHQSKEMGFFRHDLVPEIDAPLLRPPFYDWGISAQDSDGAD